MADTEGTIVLPKQHVKRGRGIPGYKGKDIEIVDDDGKVVGHGKVDQKTSAKATKAKG